jgi:hypothetical protein
MIDFPKVLMRLDCPGKRNQIIVKQLSLHRASILVPPACGSRAVLRRVRPLLPKSILDIKIVNE